MKRRRKYGQKQLSDVGIRVAQSLWKDPPVGKEAIERARDEIADLCRSREIEPYEKEDLLKVLKHFAGVKTLHRRK